MADDIRRRKTAPEQSIRTAAVWATLSEALRTREQEAGRPLHVVDLGGGAGGLAVPVAELGHHVIVVDPSPNALAALTQRAAETGVSGQIMAIQGDAETLAETLAEVARSQPVDLVSCHGVLEHMDDPRAAILTLASVLAPGGLLSLVVAQRLGTVVARALAGRFAEARTALLSPDGRWGDDDPLRRRADAAGLAELLAGAGLDILGAEGVRLFGDLVPPGLLGSEAERAALLDLERTIATHPASAHLAHIAPALHVLARRREED